MFAIAGSTHEAAVRLISSFVIAAHFRGAGRSSPPTTCALHAHGGGAATRRRRRRVSVWLAVALAGLGVQASVAAGQTPVRAPIVVTTTADAPDTSAGDGLCRTAGNQCSVRAAVQEANGLIGHDVIEIPAGTYEIEIPVLNEDFPSTGDHDIVDSVTIRGVGASQTILDGGFPLPDQPVEARGLDRIFEIHPSAGNVTIEQLTLQEGYTE
jgi:CSLREA domain-containing protein